jgi:nicotinic acetylcholine receptor, invertebrate
MIKLHFLKVLDDWRYIAMVIDRLQLYVFLAVTVGGTIGILCHAPHIFEYIDQEDIRNRLVSSHDGVI